MIFRRRQVLTEKDVIFNFSSLLFFLLVSAVVVVDLTTHASGRSPTETLGDDDIFVTIRICPTFIF